MTPTTLDIPKSAGNSQAMSTPDKIRSFGHLAPGWHYGNGGPAASDIVELALAAEKMLRGAGYPETGAFPGVDGEIQVTGYRGTQCVTVEIRCDTRTEGN